LGISQLNRAKEGVEKRNRIAVRYNEAFKDLDTVKTPFVADDVYHAYHLYIIQAEQRKELYGFLREHDIFTQVHYIPVHLQPYYRSMGWKKGDFPAAEDYYEKALSLPMYPALTEDEQVFVIEKIKEFYS
jgi:dTDP-4-amino-4,6-dideoxygalactose transaminase